MSPLDKETTMLSRIITSRARPRRTPIMVALLAGTIPGAFAHAQPATIIQIGEPTSNSSVSTSGISDAQEAVGRSSGGM